MKVDSGSPSVYDEVSDCTGVHFQGILKDYKGDMGEKCAIVIVEDSGTFDSDYNIRRFNDKFRHKLSVFPPDNMSKAIVNLLHEKYKK